MVHRRLMHYKHEQSLVVSLAFSLLEFESPMALQNLWCITQIIREYVPLSHLTHNTDQCSALQYVMTMLKLGEASCQNNYAFVTCTISAHCLEWSQAHLHLTNWICQLGTARSQVCKTFQNGFHFSGNWKSLCIHFQYKNNIFYS